MYYINDMLPLGNKIITLNNCHFVLCMCVSNNYIQYNYLLITLVVVIF